MLRVWVYGEGGARDAAVEDLPRLLEAGEETLWVDIAAPDEDCVRVLLEIFRFHPLAVEDTRNGRQRPKAEEYPDHLFLILNPAAPGRRDRPEYRELDVFLGRHYVVTAHLDDDPVIEAVRRRLSGNGAPPPTAGFIAYALLDQVVDDYFPMLDRFQQHVEEIEDRLLAEPNRTTLGRLFKMKRDLVELRRVVGPQRDMFNLLTRRDLAYIDQEQLQYQLRDVYDHLLRITDMTDSFRDLLTSSVDLYMSAVSNRLNTVVNRLTILTVLLGSLAVIVGFYGMNFEHTWPPFDAAWGVPFTLALMVAAIAAGRWIFRKLDML